MLELEHALLSISKLFVPELRHKLKSAEQILMQREIEETKRKATDLPVRHSAHLLQTESQQTELIILHQLVVSTRQSVFKQIVEPHRHQMPQLVVDKLIHVDQQVLTIDEALTEQTVQHPTGDLIQPIGQEQIVALAQQMQRQEEVKLIHVAPRAQKTVDAQTVLTRDHKALVADQE
jgi:hypothetical protein